MSDEFNMLGSLGVEVPYKVVRLSKPPSAFIMEAGDVCAKYEKKKIEAAQLHRSPAPRQPSERRMSRSGSCTSGVSGGSHGSNVSSWRSDWRPHAHPMQRSHFSAMHPGSMVLGSVDGPISENAMEIQNHRKLKRHPSPRGPHPLEEQHYGNQHKTKRCALQSVDGNRLAAAGAPSEKITRTPVPSDITARSREPSMESVAPQPVVHVQPGPKLWTAERDRRERDREATCVVGRERVLRASSPPKEVVPEGPRMWTAERDLRQKQRSSSTPNHHLQHEHRKLYGQQTSQDSRVGVQPSDLQVRWGEAGWWAPQSSPNEVRTKPEYIPPSPSARATYGVPNYSHRMYETNEMSMRRRARSPSSSQRRWKP